MTCRCADGENATLSEFEEVLKAMKMSSLIPLAPRIFDLFDNNRDGTVDMREILCGFSSLKNSKGDDALRLCFQVQNSFMSGKKSTISHFLNSSSPKLTELKVFLFSNHDQMYDTDGSGCISKEEVASMLRVISLPYSLFKQ